MKKIIAVLGFMGFSQAFGATSPGYTLAHIDAITGGIIDSAGNTTFTVDYWYQPCAQSVLNIVQSPLVSPIPAKSVIALGVVIADKGIKCMGPTMKESKLYQINGPFPVEGVTAFPIQPTL